MDTTTTPSTPARFSVVDEAKLERDAEDWLHTAPAKVVACHGFGHAFPKPGSRRGFDLNVEADGWQRLDMKCRDCGVVRYIEAPPGAVIELPAERYRYDYTQVTGGGRYGSPKGTGKLLPRRRYAQEATRRWREEMAHPTGGEDFPEGMAELAGQAAPWPPTMPEAAPAKEAAK